MPKSASDLFHDGVFTFSDELKKARIAEVVAEISSGKLLKDALEAVVLRHQEEPGRNPGAGTLHQWVKWHPDYVRLMETRKKSGPK